MKYMDHRFTDLKHLLELSDEERSRILETAAETARSLYDENTDLSDFMIPGEIYTDP